MTVAIVADSTISLPPALVAGLPLYVVPMEIHHDGRVYRDGVDLPASKFYTLQAASASLPTTSAPQPGAFLDAFTSASKVASEIVCVTLSSELSATYQAALAARDQAAGALPGTRIEVVDSRCAGTAQGLITLAAAREAANGSAADQIVERIRAAIPNVFLYGYLDSLYYVWKGGRVPRVLMWMGRLLGVKPILQLSDGVIGMVERPRTARRAMERVAALAAARAKGAAAVRIAVMHANAPERAEELAERLRSMLDPLELFVTEFTPVIGAHTGPGLVGCAIHRLDERV